MLSTLLVARLLVALAAATAPEEPDQGRFVQDRFAVGFWVDPPADERMDERYQEIRDAHFTVVLGGHGATSPEAVARQLELCEKYGLKGIVHSGSAAPSDLPTSPACWGYLVRDEPNASDFGSLRERVDTIREARPGALAYINLFPNYGTPGHWGTSTYEDYVAKFMETVRPDVLSMDHYPLFAPQSDGRDRYCENLEVMRKFSLHYRVPFWNFFNTMPYGGHTDPTEAQLRWQIYASLAYGAKGVFYFCYYTPVSDEFPKGGAIIRRDGSRTRHYDQAARINAELKNLGPTLMKLTSRGVYRVPPERDPGETLAGAPLRLSRSEPHDPALDLLVGVFRHDDGRRAVLVHNYRFAFTAWLTVEFDSERVVEIDKATGVETGVRDESPELGELQISLDAGDGRLFLME